MQPALIHTPICCKVGPSHRLRENLGHILGDLTQHDLTLLSMSRSNRSPPPASASALLGFEEPYWIQATALCSASTCKQPQWRGQMHTKSLTADFHLVHQARQYLIWGNGPVTRCVTYTLGVAPHSMASPQQRLLPHMPALLLGWMVHIIPCFPYTAHPQPGAKPGAEAGINKDTDCPPQLCMAHRLCSQNPCAPASSRPVTVALSRGQRLPPCLLSCEPSHPDPAGWSALPGPCLRSIQSV